MNAIKKKINNLMKNSFRDTNTIITVIISGIFLGLSDTKDDINKSIFLVPITTYIYVCTIRKYPLLLLPYFITFFITSGLTN